MTEDNKRLITIEGDFKDMKEDFKGMQEDITEIKSALIGNEISGDKGMVGKVDRLEFELSKLTEDRIKNSIYITQLSWAMKAIGTTVTGIILVLVKTYLNK
jgi:hypothetical protein